MAPCRYTGFEEWFINQVKGEGVEGVLVMLGDVIDEEVLNAAMKLKVVSTVSAGFDHIHLPGLKSRNIRLAVTPDPLTDAVADLSVMLALMAQRRGKEAMREVEAGNWPNLPWSPLSFCGPQIKHTTVGFVGFGRIAQATLVRLLPFGISKVLYLTSQPGKPASSDYYNLLSPSSPYRIPITPATSISELAKTSDIVFICCALTPETHHLISDPFFSLTKPTSVIINTARGGVLDSSALERALVEGKVFGAGLDVVEGEPEVGSDHGLVKHSRCVVVPHIGSANTETREMMAVEAVKNLLAGIRGEEMVTEKKL